MKAHGTKAFEEINRKLKTLHEIMDQNAEFVAAKGTEALNAAWHR